MVLHCYTSSLQNTGCYTVTQAHSQITKILAVAVLHEDTSRYQRYWLLHFCTVTQAHPQIAMILAVTLLREHPSRYQRYWLLCCYTSNLPVNKYAGCYAVTLAHFKISRILAFMLFIVTRVHFKMSEILAVTLSNCHMSTFPDNKGTGCYAITIRRSLS